MINLKNTAIIFLLSFIAFNSCGDSSTGQSHSDDNQNIPLEEITASITPAGGTIVSETGEWEIEFPAGALTETTEITIKSWPDTSKSIPEGYRSMFPIIEFGPHGIEFPEGITLRIHYEQGDMPEGGLEERLIRFYYLNNNGTLEMAESTVDTELNIVEVTLPHFSLGWLLDFEIWLVNTGLIENEIFVDIVADQVVAVLESIPEEEREEFIEDNMDLLGPFYEQVEEILEENPLDEIISSEFIFYEDADGDGYGNPESSQMAATAPDGYVEDNTDCNDTSASVFPGAEEIPADGLDNDCDGLTDENSYYYEDADGDGFGNAAVSQVAGAIPDGYVEDNTDCDDSDASIHPGAEEIPGDGTDNDCDGLTDETSYYYQDADNDGYGNPDVSEIAETAPAGYVEDNTDCDDTDAFIHPGAEDIPGDGFDNDCDGLTDETLYYYEDADGDGFGNPLIFQIAETAPAGYVTDSSDCDDTDPDVHPGAEEIPGDGIDNDCDGLIDETLYYYQDADGDGFGNSAVSQIAETVPAGYVADNTDCNDSNASIYPGAQEIPADGFDNDCDGLTDETTYYYEDADGDGFGNPAVSQIAETAPSGYVTDNTDCDDSDASIHPGAEEIPGDGIDNDCDGLTDETSYYYQDADGDNFGNPAVSQIAETAPSGYVTDNTDCDDTNASINPGADEICNGVDDNCNSSVDEDVQTTYYLDADGDGYGAAGFTTQACSVPAGYSENSNDCDDTQYAVNPGGEEVCNGYDDNCSGEIDEGVSTTYYRDADGDGFGTVYQTTQTCELPDGYVEDSTDCDDTEASIYPGADETCNGEDDDCNGTIDDGVQNTYYLDADGDGYGDAGMSIQACEQPDGYVEDNTDCDDTNASINPGAEEVCNGYDDNCNSLIDDEDGISCVPPEAPAGVTASDLTSTSVNVTWEPSAGATYYRVYRAAWSGKGVYELVADNVTETSFDYTEDWLEVSDETGEVPAMLVTDDAASSTSFIGIFDDYIDDALPALMDFKSPGYFKVEACNATGCSSMSDYDAGQPDYVHTNTESEVAQVIAPLIVYPAMRAFAAMPGDITVLNWCGMDLCGNIGGMVMGRLDTTDIFSGTIPQLDIYYENYTLGSNASSNANITLDGYMGGMQAMTDALNGIRTVSGNFSVRLTNGQTAEVSLWIKVDKASSQNTGYAEVTYGGNSYKFTLPVHPTNGEAIGVAAPMSSAESATWTNIDSRETDYPTPFSESAPSTGCVSNEPTVSKYCTRIAYVYYQDADGDGYGNPDQRTTAYTQPAGYVGDNTDCDDTNADIHPGAAELCNSVDDDCNGAIDDDIEYITYYQDADGDGFGNAGISMESCDVPDGYVTDNTDCDDTDASVYPGAEEVCDGLDNDCNGTVDDGVQNTYYLDADGDGFGDSSQGTEACSLPDGYAENGSDCDDTDAAVYPGAEEIPGDGIDNDCDGLTDETTYYYEDYDGDGFGNPAVYEISETLPTGYTTDNTDCDDTNASVYPGAQEIPGDGIDNDCDGATDETSYYYEDADGDGYGNPDVYVIAETAPAGYVTDNTDYDDTDPYVHIPPYYTVTFDSQGGDYIAPVEAVPGTLLTEPNNLINGDLIFSGWHIDSGCTEPWDFNNDVVTEDVTLYAKWNAADSLTFTLINEDTEYEVRRGTGGPEGTLFIPAYYQGIPVTSIGGYSFNSCTTLTNVIIPGSVTSIGNYAFYSCTSLSSIALPDSITSIGEYAFRSCRSLSNITIPAGITTINRAVFYGCISLDNISIPSSVTTIRDQAFRDCTLLSSITIPSSVTIILNAAFSGCTLLNSVTIPDTITTLSRSIFYQCTSLENISIPSSVITIEDYAFSGCTSLNNITIPDSITTIGNYAFSGCTSLDNITIPDSVTSIGENAFRLCSSFTGISIPDSVTSIGDGAFATCTSLNNITIPDSITSIGNSLFGGCSSLSNISIPNSVISIGNNAFSGCSSLSNITIPESVTSIGNYAFMNCTSLSSITIPNSVTSIGEYAFRLCSSLNNITIPENITILAYGVFSDCTSLSSITIPESVTSIEHYTFDGCTSLNSITIPDSVTNIGCMAFGNCSSLSDITIPSSVTNITYKAFSYSNALNNIYVDPSNNYYSSIDGVVYDKAATTLVAYPGGKTYTSDTIPSSVTVIGDYSFCGCTTFTSIEIPSGITTIELYAFWDCYSLTSIVIPSSVATIEQGTFYNCYSLPSIIIPSSVTIMGANVFDKCDLITIYCEASAQPSGWSSNWNPDDRPVVWGY